MKKKCCITFAGVVGSSKSPTAHYLSWNIGFPIQSNDAMRIEVTEDLLRFDADEYSRRLNQRAKEILSSGRSFIYDASVDRKWSKLDGWLKEYDYESFVISLDFSRSLIERIHAAKGYQEAHRLDALMQEHADFLKNYGDVVNLHINDEQFPDRLELSLIAVKDWLSK